jgi:hypothetical protein
MATYLEDRSFRHIFDKHTGGFYLFTVITFVDDVTRGLDGFLLWTKPSGDVIDVGNLLLAHFKLGRLTVALRATIRMLGSAAFIRETTTSRVAPLVSLRKCT